MKIKIGISRDAAALDTVKYNSMETIGGIDYLLVEINPIPLCSPIPPSIIEILIEGFEVTRDIAISGLAWDILKRLTVSIKPKVERWGLIIKSGSSERTVYTEVNDDQEKIHERISAALNEMYEELNHR